MNGNGRAEARVLLGDHEVARERDPERAREDVAVGRTDRGFAELAKQPEDRGEALGGEVLMDQRYVSRKPGQIGAGGEDPLVGGAQDHAAHSRVVAGRLERRGELPEQLVGQRVASLRLVQGDRGHTGVRDLVEKRLERHGRVAYGLFAVCRGLFAVCRDMRNNQRRPSQTQQEVGSATVYFARRMR